MKKKYSGTFNIRALTAAKSLASDLSYPSRKLLYTCVILFCIILPSIPSASFSQNLVFGYSYYNLSRNTAGGTLQQGDTIEVHALLNVKSTTYKMYYIDTIPVGTQYVSNSIRLTTNEGVLYAGSGPYTDASGDDLGVYVSTGVPRVRVNIGSTAGPAYNGANFGLTTGGGTITSGTSLPRFYGTTLFIVAYKLLVTANYGDTLHPTGNFYYATSKNGSIQEQHIDYGAIKVIQNRALCNNFASATFTAESSFGSGNIQNRVAPAIVPGYTKINIGANSPADNYYSIVNNTSADGTINNAGPYQPTANAHRVFGGFWDIIGDHTGAASPGNGNPPPAAGQPGGYMLVVNAAFTGGEVYRDTIKNVCPNTQYEFSAWIRNLCGVCGLDQNSTPTYTPGVLPNLTYAINDVDYYTTGNITHNNYWQKRGFIYKTGPTETQFTITIKNNAAGGGGNDWVLDDIELSTCYPNLVNSPKDTASSCATVPLSLSDTVKSYFNNYTNYCWEKSADGINWTSTGVCGSKVPTLVDGLYQYVVDTTFIPVAADSGTYYRLKVGTTAANLTNPNCSVSNSQKIFLKVFNVNCTLLQTHLSSFTGTIITDHAVLRWTSQSESNLKQYEVEKSIDGVHFSQIGIVATMNNSNGADYAFTDPEPVSAIAYYRLKLIGIANNNNTYSKIIVLYNKNASVNVSVVNPFRTSLKVNIFLPEDGNAIFDLYDIFGKMVSKKNIQLSKGTSQLSFDDVEQLPTGIYILRTQFNNKIIQNKLFKVD